MSAGKKNKHKGRQPRPRTNRPARTSAKGSSSHGLSSKSTPSKNNKPTPPKKQSSAPNKRQNQGSTRHRHPNSSRRPRNASPKSRPTSAGVRNRSSETRYKADVQSTRQLSAIQTPANLGSRDLGTPGGRNKKAADTPIRRTGRGTSSGKKAAQETTNQDAPFWFRLPRKLRITAYVLAVLLVILAIDSIANSNQIHRGVSIAGIDVGGLTQSEASDKLDTELGQRFSTASIKVTPDADSAERWLASTDLSTLTSGNTYTAEQLSELNTLKARMEQGDDIDEDITSTQTAYWSIDRATIGASYDSSALAQQAYSITRASNILVALGQRLHTIFGVKLKATASFDQTNENDIIRSINNALGITMKNNDITIDSSGNVTTTEGREGWALDEDGFNSTLESAFISGSNITYTASMDNVPIQIDADQAEEVASSVRDIIASPFTITYQGQTWTADAGEIGSWISTKVEISGKKNEIKTLVPYVETKKAVSSIQKLMGSVGYGTAVNASFDVSSGTPVIIPSQNGTGPDLTSACNQIQDILFGEGGERTITLNIGNATPELTTEDAQSMGIVELISEYTLTYDSDNANRTYNIERCLDFMNNTMVGPGQNWDWNEQVGECDETTGFKEAGVYVNGKGTTEAGGGICNAATGVFNAAYEGGFPIVDRSAHSQYSTRYPLGRDATVSWTEPDLIFTNDTDNWILLTSSSDGTYLHIYIWGTSLLRKVESQNTDLQTTSSGYSITNYRKVYDATGKLLWEDAFPSSFSKINDP